LRDINFFWYTVGGVIAFVLWCRERFTVSFKKNHGGVFCLYGFIGGVNVPLSLENWNALRKTDWSLGLRFDIFIFCWMVCIGVFAANSNALHIFAMLISNLSSFGINWASKRRLLMGVVRNAPNASLKAEW